MKKSTKKAPRKRPSGIRRSFFVSPRLLVLAGFVVAAAFLGWSHFFSRPAKAPLDDGMPVHVTESQARRYYDEGRYELSLKECRAAIARDPDYYLSYYWLGRTQEALGQFPEAELSVLQALDRIFPSRPSMMLATLGRVRAAQGKKAAALEIKEELLEARKNLPVYAFDLAVLCLGLGQKQEALDWLSKAAREQSGHLVFLVKDPRFESVREEPAFKAVFEEMEL